MEMLGCGKRIHRMGFGSFDLNKLHNTHHCYQHDPIANSVYFLSRPSSPFRKENPTLEMNSKILQLDTSGKGTEANLETHTFYSGEEVKAFHLRLGYKSNHDSYILLLMTPALRIM